MKLPTGFTAHPTQKICFYSNFFCGAAQLAALGIPDFESTRAERTDLRFITLNEKYSVHHCRLFRNVILLSCFWGTPHYENQSCRREFVLWCFSFSPECQLMGFYPHWYSIELTTAKQGSKTHCSWTMALSSLETN